MPRTIMRPDHIYTLNEEDPAETLRLDDASPRCRTCRCGSAAARSTSVAAGYRRTRRASAARIAALRLPWSGRADQGERFRATAGNAPDSRR